MQTLLFLRDSNTPLFPENNGVFAFGGAEISAVWPTLSEEVQLAILKLAGLIQ
jgi:hypothetical protein